MKSLFVKFCLLVCILLFSVSCSRPIRSYLIANIFPPSVVKVGDDMVDAKLLDANGKKKKLSDFRSDKYLLLNFGGGCGNFIASLPELSEVSEMYSENLTLIIINVDTKKQWKELMAEYDMQGIKKIKVRCHKLAADFDFFTHCHM